MSAIAKALVRMPQPSAQIAPDKRTDMMTLTVVNPKEALMNT